MKYVVCLAAVAAMMPAAASAAGTTGARVEARLGWETPTVSGGGDVYKIGSAVSYGAEVGYDAGVGGKWAVGPYVVYERSSVKNCTDGYCLKVRSNLAGGLRVGYAVGQTSVVYGKVGYASMRISASTPIDSVSDSKGGIQGALGFEGGMGKGAYWGVEANYGDYGKWEGINVQRRQVAAKVGFRF